MSEIPREDYELLCRIEELMRAGQTVEQIGKAVGYPWTLRYQLGKRGFHIFEVRHLELRRGQERFADLVAAGEVGLAAERPED